MKDDGGRRAFEKFAEGVARLSNCDGMSCFSYGGRNIRFRTSPRLTRYNKVLSWENGFIEVLAQYGKRLRKSILISCRFSRIFTLIPNRIFGPFGKWRCQMSEKERDAIADAADMIVNNYAFTKDGDNIRILNLRTETAALLLPDGRVSETSMEDIELDVVLAYFEKNKKHLEI